MTYTEHYQLFFDTFPIALPILAGLFGLLVGSFLNVVAYRFPLMLEQSWIQDAKYIMQIIEAGHSLIRPRPLEFEQSLPQPEEPKITLSKPRSHCPKCKTQIKAWQNIPLVSFLILKGKCANSDCDAKIPKRYFGVELVTGLMSFAVGWYFGYSLVTLAALFLTWVLIALTLIDFDTQLLPDQIVLPLLWIGIILNYFDTFVSLESAVLGTIAGYMSLWILFDLFKMLTGKEGMGFGDFKLYAALGAWLGISALPAILMIASVIGSIFGISMILMRGHNSQKPIAFGPYLAIGGWIFLLWSESINTLLPVHQFAMVMN